MGTNVYVTFMYILRSTNIYDLPRRNSLYVLRVCTVCSVERSELKEGETKAG